MNGFDCFFPKDCWISVWFCSFPPEIPSSIVVSNWCLLFVSGFFGLIDLLVLNNRDGIESLGCALLCLGSL